MKIIFPVLVLACFLFSCKNSATEKKVVDVDSTQAAEDPVPAGSQKMAEAMVGLKAILLSNDKEQIAALFDFPIPDNVLRAYIDDSVYQEKYRLAGDQITRTLFMDYFDTISRYTNLSDVIRGLEYLPIDSLRYTGKLSRDKKNENEFCYMSYSIELQGENEIMLRFSMDENEDYVAAKGSKEEEMGPEGCEYMAYFIFRFEGGKWKFASYAAAG